MTRWHKPDCVAPDVHIDNDNRPTCRACASACPPISALVAKSKNASSGIKLPPDEPRGQMNLWWPKDVLYLNQKPIEETETLSHSSPNVGNEEEISKLTINLDKTTNSHIYENTLESNEFRLVCLTAVPRKDYPVHLSLETYRYDDRPEYETVSYMWGGENGNSTPCRPIFIGPYWDVILQSQNCWAMLNSVRPWRGTRMMWVDALCINQNDLEERAAQVARMRQIYGESSRVVVFLGEDIVTDTTKFPTYVNLDDINSVPSYGDLIRIRDHRASVGPLAKSHTRPGATDNLSKLLQRAYFSRVWVIQELIGSDRAVLRVGNVDFRADAAAIYRISRRQKTLFSWSQTRAPWVQYLGQKAVNPARAKDLVSLAALTSRCRATDPRDRIFAIAQLLVDAKLRESLSANYTLSFQHLAIGFFAHALLVSRKSFFLDHAGLLNSTWSPSWVPECRSDAAWERALGNAIPRQYDITPYERISTTDCQIYLDPQCIITVRELITVYDYRPAYIKPAIDSATGALLMDLTHLFVFEHEPRLLRSYGNLHIYGVISRNWYDFHKQLCFFAWTRLDIAVGDHLFTQPMSERIEDQVRYGNQAPIAVHRDDKFDPRGLMYLVLRPRPSEHGLVTFELVTTRLGLCASFPNAPTYPSEVNFVESDWPAIRNYNFLRLSEVHTSVASTITSIMNVLIEARTVVFSEEQLKYITQLPTGHGSVSREKASIICDAFYGDSIGIPREDYWGNLGAVLINVESRRELAKRGLLIVQAMRTFLVRNNVKTLLDAIGNAFEPPLGIMAVARLIKAGPTEDQKYIGIPKYINGVKVDGSISRVLVV